MALSMQLRRALASRDKIQDLTLHLVESDPWVPLKLGWGSKEYKLEYSYGAVVEVFQATGKVLSDMDITETDLRNPDLFMLLLAAGLRTHHANEFPEDIDPKKLMAMIPMRHLNYIRTSMLVALQAAEPAPEDVARILEEVESQYPEEQPDARPLVVVPTSEDSGDDASDAEFTPSV